MAFPAVRWRPELDTGLKKGFQASVMKCVQQMSELLLPLQAPCLCRGMNWKSDCVHFNYSHVDPRLTRSPVFVSAACLLLILSKGLIPEPQSSGSD